MSEYLLLVRHSAVEIDSAVPSRTWPLSADGRSRCHVLAPKLKPYAPSRFVTSEEPKAMETGKILANALGAPVMSAPGLQEHDRHGTPYFESKAAFETAVATFFARPHELVFGRETAVQARMRFETAVQHALTRQTEGNLAIVAHGTVITLFICHHNPQLEPMQFWQSLNLPCAFVLQLPAMRLIATV